MMGRSHLVANTAMAGAGAVLLGALGGGAGGLSEKVASWGASPGLEPLKAVLMELWAWIEAGASWLQEWLVPEWARGSTELLPGWSAQPTAGWLAAGLALLLLGSVLPDLDSSKSMLGRHVRFPGPHRGIMHTDWALIGLLALGIAFRPMMALWIGYAMHLVLDGASAGGRARFYPLGRYRKEPLPGGGSLVMPSRSRRGVYKVGSPGEAVLLAVIVAGCSGLAWGLLAL